MLQLEGGTDPYRLSEDLVYIYLHVYSIKNITVAGISSGITVLGLDLSPPLPPPPLR